MLLKNIFLWLSLPFMAVGATGCITEDSPENTGVEAGNPLPQFSVFLNNGQTITTSSLRGKVAVIEFFNTSCQDCRKAFPVVQQIYDSYRDVEDVLVFCIARDETAESIQEYWIANQLTIPYSPQSGREVYNLFASVGIPRMYIADKTGTITWCSPAEEIPSLPSIVYQIERARN